MTRSMGATSAASSPHGGGGMVLAGAKTLPTDSVQA
jgi:hypothetical protein